jgi:trigger factor
MMGESITAEEVFNVVTKELNGYIKDNKLALIGDPLPAESEKDRVIDWKAQKDFEFTYDLGTIPAFDIALDKESLEAYEVELEDKTIDATIENILKQNAVSTNPDKVDVEDYVSGELKQVGGEFSAEKSMIPMNKAAKTEGKKFVGKKVGDVIKFDLQKLFKKDTSAISHVAGVSKEETAELIGDFEFTITSLTRTEPAEINQELFDKMYGKDEVKTEEEFKAKLSETLNENNSKDADFLVSKQVKDALTESSDISYSKEFFKRWILESNKGNISETDLEEKFDAYEAELKWTFVRNKIAETNDLKVEADEVRAKAEEVLRYQMLGGMEITPDLRERFDEFITKYLQEEGGKNYYNTFDQVMNDKVFTHVKGAVEPQNKKVKSEEFKAIVEEATKQ